MDLIGSKFSIPGKISLPVIVFGANLLPAIEIYKKGERCNNFVLLKLHNMAFPSSQEVFLVIFCLFVFRVAAANQAFLSTQSGDLVFIVDPVSHVVNTYSFPNNSFSPMSFAVRTDIQGKVLFVSANDNDLFFCFGGVVEKVSLDGTQQQQLFTYQGTASGFVATNLAVV
jgi:hypothetical protein